MSEMDASSNENILNKLVILAQADSASTGLEFSAAPKIIYYSNSFNGSARMQSEDRVHSMNTKSSPLIIDYIHLPTDELVLKNLKTKKDLQSISLGEVLDYLSLEESLNNVN
jgi:SNF2 family DNA or RNA helicase